MRGRHRVSTGSPYEPRIGISRAVRVGNVIAVTGTAPLGPDGKTVGRGDPAAQSRRSLEIIREALRGVGVGSVGRDTNTDSTDSNSRLGAGGAGTWGVLW